jgi:Putative peptidoglycan binding domain
VVVRLPEPRVGTARDAEERHRVAEIARDIEELGRALEGRDRLARFARAERANETPPQAGQSAGGDGNPSTPEPEPLPTFADTSRAPKEVSPQVGKFATIPPSPQQRRLVADGGPPTGRLKWRTSLAVVIIVLPLVSGGALMLMGPLTEIAQDAYRSAVAEMKRLTAGENAGTEAAARKAADEKLAAVAAAHREEARQAAEEKARAEAAREVAATEARAAAQEATDRQTAEDARLKAEEVALKAAEGKPKSDAEVREQAKRAEADLNLSEQDRKKVQTFLTALGFNTNGTDGAFGPRTRAMIMAWQKTQGLSETSYLTKAQFATLQQQASAALAKFDRSQQRVKENPRGTRP